MTWSRTPQPHRHPQFGDDYLGKCAIDRLLLAPDELKIISGVGFIDEVAPLIAAAGPGNTVHLKIVAGGGGPGADLPDSREELFLAPFGVEEIILVNNFDDRFDEAVVSAVDEVIGLSNPSEDRFANAMA